MEQKQQLGAVMSATQYPVTQTSIAAGEYDWLATWRDMYDCERAQAEQFPPPAPEIRNDCWAGQASRFAAAAQRGQQPDGFMRFLLPRLRPTDRVLDIGAGSGRYEPTLAAAVAEVHALEPSAAMREHLAQGVAEAGLANVRVHNTSWPAEGMLPCDVAIAAHVLYAVREVGPFLRAMYTSARRAGFVLLSFRHPSSFVGPFWERLRGEARLPLPGALECLNALYQLGIPAQLARIPMLNRFSYANEDEALADLRWRLRLPADAATDQVLAAAIGDLLDRDNNGHLAPRQQPSHAAVLWWERAACEDI